MEDFIQLLARNAGEICLRESEHLGKGDIDFKSAKDIVTRVDRLVEEYIIDEIKEKYLKHSIYGEETGITSGDKDSLWIIDPIDGTTSYWHGQLYYSVSIAFQKDGKLELGVVYAPGLNHLFYAKKGGGAFLNGQPIMTSGSKELINSVLSTGFTCMRDGRRDNNLENFNRILPKIRDFRRGGSAALDLAYVAAGKLDGYWEMNLNLYDVAAGVLLVEEAGGQIVDFNGLTNYPDDGLIATNGHLTESIRQYLK